MARRRKPGLSPIAMGFAWIHYWMMNPARSSNPTQNRPSLRADAGKGRAGSRRALIFAALLAVVYIGCRRRNPSRTGSFPGHPGHPSCPGPFGIQPVARSARRVADPRRCRAPGAGHCARMGCLRRRADLDLRARSASALVGRNTHHRGRLRARFRPRRRSGNRFADGRLAGTGENAARAVRSPAADRTGSHRALVRGTADPAGDVSMAGRRARSVQRRLPLEARVPGARFALRRNPNYREADQVAADAVVWHVTEDPSAELGRFRAGELHITEAVPPGRLDWLQRELGDSLRIAPYLGSFYLVYNLRRAPFENSPELREALSLAIDRDIIVNRVLGTGELPAWRLVPPGLQDWPGTPPPEARLSRTEQIERARNCSHAPAMARAGRLPWSSASTRRLPTAGYRRPWPRCGSSISASPRAGQRGMEGVRHQQPPRPHHRDRSRRLDRRLGRPGQLSSAISTPRAR